MERDKFLTEAIGECNHGFKYCGVCVRPYKNKTDFSTWEGFGKLWTWAQEQEWYFTFKQEHFWIDDCGCPVWCECSPDLTLTVIHPDRFANAVYEFLKEK